MNVAVEKDELSKSLKKSFNKRSLIEPIVCDKENEFDIYELSKSQEEMNVEVESIDDDKFP